MNCPLSLRLALEQMKRWRPFMIVWGYKDALDCDHVFAHATRRQLNTAVRKGHAVFLAE